MWKDTRVPRAPEKSFTGIEMSPNVRYPDHTEEAIVCHLNAKLLNARAWPVDRRRGRSLLIHSVTMPSQGTVPPN
jgi:hypothetical protein